MLPVLIGKVGTSCCWCVAMSPWSWIANSGWTGVCVPSWLLSICLVNHPGSTACGPRSCGSAVVGLIAVAVGEAAETSIKLGRVVKLNEIIT